MKPFYPFIYEKRKEDFEPLPLYIELIPPPDKSHQVNEDNDEDNSSHIIEIDMF